MTPEESALLRTVLLQQPVAALATLHRDAPAVSMVPFVWWPAGAGVLIHVSQLAPHTQDMQQHATVSLLVMGSLSEVETPLALPRVSLTGTAQALDKSAPVYEQAREVYLNKHPDAEPLFDFEDFSLVRVTPQSLRWVAGFGRAMAVRPDALAELLSEPS